MSKIAVVSVSNRKGGLDIVQKCLRKQSFRDFSWIIVSPYHYDDSSIWLQEPEKKAGDFYNLNKAWNMAFNEANAELIVSIVDYTEFSEDTIEKLWDRYCENPITCFSAIGFQYDKQGGKLTWVDTRIEEKILYPINPVHFEFRLASIPRRAIQAVGGMDEEYDKVAANSEKDLAFRISRLGYFFMIDKNISCNFYKHEEHGKEWDKKYKESLNLVEKHIKEALKGKRLRLSYVDW